MPKYATAISAKEKNIRHGHISPFNYEATCVNRTGGFFACQMNQNLVYYAQQPAYK